MNINIVCNYVVIGLLLLTTLNFNFLKKGKIIIIVIYMFIYYIINKYTYSFFSISSYYQLINYLNTKNNLLLLILMLLIFTINSNKTINVCIAITPLLYFIYNYNIIEINKLYYVFYINSNNLLNLNLLNGVMLIHPIILYMYYVLYIYTIRYLYVYTKHICVLNNKTYIYTITYKILLSILLGCWWAEQELAWGGWWSWDLVELLALNFFLLNLLNLHKSATSSSKYLYKNIILYFSTFICVLFFVRFNLINSIHNFLNSESQNQFLFYIQNIYLMLLFIAIYLYIYVNKYKHKNVFYINLINFYHIILIMLIYINIINIILFNINYIVYNTYITISVFYVLYNINTTYIFNINYIYICCTVCLFFLYKNVSYIDVIILYVVFGIILTYKNTTNNTTKKLHILIILFFYLSIHQIYLFIFDNYMHIYNLIFLNKINFINNVNHINVNNKLYGYFTGIKLYIYYLIETRYNTNNINNLYKNIFEKSIYTNNSNIFELYNYNLQQLNQPTNNSIFLVFILILFYFYIFLRSKSYKIYI